MHTMLPLVMSLLATGLVATAQGLSSETGVAALERQALGWLLVHRPSRPAHPDLRFVAVDTPLFEQQEAGELPPSTPSGAALEGYRPANCSCPVPRRCYARAIQRLHDWGARVVVLDVMFSRPCVEDKELRSALETAGNVALPVVTNTIPLNRWRDPTHATDLQFQPSLFGDLASVGSPVVSPRDQEYALELRQTMVDADRGELSDYYALAWESVCLAENRMPEDLDVISRLAVDGNQPRLTSAFFSTASARVDERHPEAQLQEVDFKVHRGNVQIDEAFFRKQILINFSCGAEPEVGRYRPSRLSWLLTCPDDAGRKLFAHKIVLIGDPARDRHQTLVGDMPGTEVLANAVATLLDRKPLRAIPVTSSLLFMFMGSLLAVCLLRESPLWLSGPGILALVAGVVALSLNLAAHDLWMLTVSPIASIAIAALLVAVVENSRFQKTLAQLVPRRISRMVERAGGFGVEEGSVLFSDIRGYTTLSEQMNPAEMMSYLNRYMSTVDRVLSRHGGHFLKSPGDCVVAWFGEERRGGAHRERAVRAGLEILENAERFAKSWQEETGLAFAVGVGINSGPMAVGVLDAQRHLEPTIIGDVVNTAARIESLTKQYEAALLVSEETLGPVREAFDAEFVDEVQVKGRAQPVRLYVVRSPHPRPQPGKGRGGWLKERS
jgi:class 3 adenylate cyclase/CHASE2 domain-containing sensor protein